jgi:hypothetical protein
LGPDAHRTRPLCPPPLGEFATVLIELRLASDLEVDVRLLRKQLIDLRMIDDKLSELGREFKLFFLANSNGLIMS